MVMSLIYGHEAYIAHIGDSRVYRITRTGCHQMTLDDDLATREVRLSGVLYREALGMNGSGSLFQALGMNSSTALHPNIRRMIIDEECIFLLCSDGVSDRDRVEQYWQTEILPVLEGKVDLATACQRTINMANTRNGHDNATVALVHCQVKQPVETGQTAMLYDLPVDATAFTQSDTLLLSSPDTNHLDADQIGRSPVSVSGDGSSKKPLIFGAIALTLAAIGAGGWLFLAMPKSSTAPAISPSPAVSPVVPGEPAHGEASKQEAKPEPRNGDRRRGDVPGR
jgi:protein phosphatase